MAFVKTQLILRILVSQNGVTQHFLVLVCLETQSENKDMENPNYDFCDEFSQPCDLCAQKHEATRQCLDCGVLMCLDISRVHCMLKENKDHRVATIQEAQEHLRAHPLPVVLMCPDHPDKAFEYFDESCQKLVCVNCVVFENHSGHKCKSIPEAARVGREEFQQVIEDLSSKIAELQTQGTSTQGVLQDFSAIAQSRRTEVDSVFDKLIDDLETRRVSLHQQIDAMVEKKSSLLNNQFHSGESVKNSMEVLYSSFNDLNAITNDSQWLMKLLEVKKELTKVNQLFVSNRGSFSNLIPSGVFAARILHFFSFHCSLSSSFD
jgi:hypothetical protein